MSKVICNRQCPYWGRCDHRYVDFFKLYKSECDTILQETFGVCFKYNPVRAESKELAISIYKLRHNIDICNTETMKRPGALEECLGIFQELIDFIVLHQEEE